MALLNLKNAQLHFGTTTILNNAQLAIEQGERICLVGRNGAGKSTLLKVLSGEIMLDDGDLIIQSEVKIARLEQDPPRNINETVFDFVCSSLSEISDLLHKFDTLSQELMHSQDSSKLDELATVQSKLDDLNGWQIEKRVKDTIAMLKLDEKAMLCDLSGGQLRRCALAKALVLEPNILFLDEPTNHLDLSSITFLEELLMKFDGAIVFISHDRAFIRKMATKIIDLDRGNLKIYPSNYEQYLLQKEEDLRVEEEQNDLFDKRLAIEEKWIRQGIKARRTRNEGRVRALKEMRKERLNRETRVGNVQISNSLSSSSGKIIFDIENANFSIDDKILLKDFTARIMRGDKIALVGDNGIGKTTFIRLLMGDLTPSSGSIHTGTKLDIAYFDQHRADLDLEKTAMDNVADGKVDVEVNGVKRHILGYLQDFLFSPDRARTPVKALSGGEKNRLLLAKMLLKPNNFLVLDEPTNDLDVETLELLEEFLTNYQGTLLLVSHDREFIDNIATECYFFEGNGVVKNYVGGYFDALAQKENSEQYLQQQEQNKRSEVDENLQEKEKNAKNVKIKTANKVKLSFNEKRELESLPALLEELDMQINELETEIGDPDFFTQSIDITEKKLQELADLQAKLETSFMRWEELEEKRLNE